MGRRLLRLEIPVFPERGHFWVHDPTVDPDTPGGPPPPASSLISANRDQMVVSCAQEHVGVQLTVEEWEDAPPPFSDGYEDEAKCVLYLRGRLSVIDTGRSDLALDSLRLAGGVGLSPRERDVSAADLDGADEVFLTNSVRGIVPVGRTPTRTFEAPGRWTRRLSDRLGLWLSESGSTDTDRSPSSE